MKGKENRRNITRFSTLQSIKSINSYSETFLMYGHHYTPNQIAKKFPYSLEPFHREELDTNKVIIVRNPQSALSMRKTHVCTGWGMFDNDIGKPVFVFRKTIQDRDIRKIQF